MKHEEWTQTQSGDWTHPDGRTIEYNSWCWWAYLCDGSQKFHTIKRSSHSAHKAAVGARWYDFPADPHDPDVMLGLLTLCAVLRVWAEAP